jgi:hypothetical protein
MEELFLAISAWLPTWAELPSVPDLPPGFMIILLVVAAAASVVWALAMNARRLHGLYEAVRAVLASSQHVTAATSGAELNSQRTLTVLHSSLSDFRSVSDSMAESQRRLDEVIKAQSSVLEDHRRSIDATLEAFFDRLTGHGDSLAAAPQSFATSIHALSGVALTIENLVDLHSKAVEGLVSRVEDLRPQIADTAASLELSFTEHAEKQLKSYKQEMASLNEEVAAHWASLITAQRDKLAQESTALLSPAEQGLKDLCGAIEQEVKALTLLWQGVDEKLGNASEDMTRNWSARLAVLQNDLSSAVRDVSNALAERVDALTHAVGVNADVVRRDILGQFEDIKETAGAYRGLAVAVEDEKKARIDDVLTRMTERVDETCWRLNSVARQVQQELEVLFNRPADFSRMLIPSSSRQGSFNQFGDWGHPGYMLSSPPEGDMSVEQALTRATRALQAVRS